MTQSALTPVAGLPRSRGRRGRTSGRDLLAAAAFAGPNLVLIVVFLLLPLVLAFVLSFYSYSGLGSTRFVGWDNYRTMFSDPTFWRSLVNTGIFAVVTVPVGMGLGLGLAVLLNSVIGAPVAVADRDLPADGDLRRGDRPDGGVPVRRECRHRRQDPFRTGVSRRCTGSPPGPPPSCR